MNRVDLVGNLCRDNEIKYKEGENATAVLRNTVAVQRKFKNKATGEYESDFISVVFFGKTAEFVNNYFKKGSKIGISGHIQTGSYTNQEGQKVYTTDVIVDDAEFVTSKSDNAEASEGAKSSDFVNVPESLESELPFR